MLLFFFFQAEDGIRDYKVTGVQTCALPISNGILGAGAPLACGAALAAKMRGDGDVAISFVGDGASNQGTFLESLNLSAVWDLPVIFVVEDNAYAEATSRTYAGAVESYIDRASGFGV